MLVILLTAPLWGGTELHFFHLQNKDLKDFKQLYTALENNYQGKNICAGGNIYPHILVRELHLIRYLGSMVNFSYDQFLTYPNCIVVFEDHDKNAPYDDFIKNMVNYAKINHEICNNFGKFWYCDNYIFSKLK